MVRQNRRAQDSTGHDMIRQNERGEDRMGQSKEVEDNTTQLNQTHNIT
jgi:hypothetical protein